MANYRTRWKNTQDTKVMHYNHFDRQLTEKEINKGEHRKFVGSFWHEIGKLQLDFLISQGLKPNHRLLDIGCGSLRGGLHFINYLNQSNYTGIDGNESLLKAARFELELANQGSKNPNLILDCDFNHKVWGNGFDYIISISLFTHLPFHLVSKCLKGVSKCISPNGKFYSSFFRCKKDQYNNSSIQSKYLINTFPNRDPYHQTFDMFLPVSHQNGMNVEYIGDWLHPRGQQMLLFTKI